MNERLSHKTTPIWWQKVRNVCGTLAALLGTIAASDTLPDEWRPYVIAITGVLGGIAGAAHLTKTDK